MKGSALTGWPFFLLEVPQSYQRFDDESLSQPVLGLSGSVDLR
jgi:hypothetical protein